MMGIILENETMNLFGYDIHSLSPNSEKLVIWQCERCNKIVSKKYRAAKKINLCLNCSNKENAVNSINKRSISMKQWYKHNNHPLKNTKRPPHVVEALKKANIGRKCSDGLKKMYSEKYKGEGNPFYGKKHSEGVRKAISKNNMIHVKRGKQSNFYGKIYHGKGDWYLKKDGKSIWMRSSWEIKFAKYLDINNIDWIYENKHFDLLLDEKECSYTPDFFLIKENKYIEIKGYWRDDAKQKYDAFRTQYPNIEIEVLMKDDLIAKEIL